MNNQVVYKKLIDLENILIKNNALNVFLITGDKSYSSANVSTVLEQFSNKICFTRFIVKSANPKIYEINIAIEQFKKSEYNAIVAIGGGSVIDTAKAIIEFTQCNSILFTAIPTTAGSGSEATPFAVYYDENNTKQSLDKTYLLPQYVILNSSFLQYLPKYQKAATAMDAFCQALESFWSKAANNESNNYALKAIQLISHNIKNYVNNPNLGIYDKMIEGSFLAGKAIAITRTTLSHALSYTITSVWNIPHGHAVALTICEVLRFNADTIPTHKLNELLETFNASSIDDIIVQIVDIMQSIGLEHKLSKLNIDNLELIAKGVNIQRLANNPKQPDYNDILHILERIY